ncbi:MAG: hypothetical protein FWF82_03270 [Oscillospiraceae bacterium]|nr:hypothetical protein [Oscillospiraceae bacterium]
MIYEEFVKLTGVTVSHRYYTEKVEVLYNADYQLDKDEFCANWVKDNKRNLVKAHEFDIDALSRDVALLEAIRTENARIKEEALTAKTKATNLELENESLKRKLANLEGDNERLTADAVRLEEVSRAIDKKENEILTLKAKLYDMMIKTA